MGFMDKIKGVIGKDSKFQSKKYIDDNPVQIRESKTVFANHFSDLKDSIENQADKIVLNSDIDFKSSIFIYDYPLIIDGNGHTVDAKGKGIFFSLSNSKVTFKNIVFKGGFSEKYGSIHCSGGNVSFENCRFIKNSCSVGGVLYNENAQLTISECEFSHNSSKTSGGTIHCRSGSTEVVKSKFFSNSSQRGSALYVLDGKVKVFDCDFHDNVAEDYGGAVEISWDALSEFKNCTFFKNTSKTGGSIFSSGTVIITDSTFEKNSSAEYGGAIYNSSSQWALKMINCVFRHNFAKNGGGGIYNEGRAFLTDVTFKGNESEMEFAADIYNDESLTVYNITSDSKSLFNNENIYLKQNSESILSIVHNMGEIYDIAPLDGDCLSFTDLQDIIQKASGEIRLERDVSMDLLSDEPFKFHEGISIDRDGLTIDGNGHSIDAKGKGSIFTITGKNIVLKNIIFKNGHLRETVYGGGAIAAKDTKVQIADCKFIENFSRSGAAIWIHESEFDIENCLFDANETLESGIIDNFGGMVNIVDCEFKSNVSRNRGIIFNDEVWSNKRTLSIKYTKFHGNSILGNGGVVDNLGNLRMDVCEMYENFSHSGVLVANKDKMEITDCEISGNSFTDNLCFNLGYLDILNTVIKNNTSKNTLFNEKILSITGGELTDNHVETATVNNSGKSCRINKTVFNGNVSDSQYCANVYNKSELMLTAIRMNDTKSIANDGLIVIKRLPESFCETIVNNADIDFAGVPAGKSFDFTYLDGLIHGDMGREIRLEEDIILKEYERDFYEGGIELNIDDLIIDGQNHVIDGDSKSRIFITAARNITLKNIIFKNGCSFLDKFNNINSDGGAIRNVFDKDVTIENCRFMDSKSERDAGAIFNKRGKIRILSSQFSNNSSRLEGGAIYNAWGEMSLKDCLFNGNSSEDKGGAIANDMDLDVDGCTFDSNDSKRGGAIYNWKNLKMSNSILKANYSEKGGAIHNDGDISIDSSSIANNSARYLGGGIYTFGGSCFLHNTTVKDNTCCFEGPNICYHSEDELVYENCNFNRPASGIEPH